MSNLIGQSLGRYHILEQLGEGGMSTVYKAFDTRLETDVAVKVIRTENLTLGTMERALKRFEREAKALARLTHPNIVKVTDYGEYEGKPYLVMPYLPGGTLKQRLGKPISWQEAIRLLIPIAEALDFAHSQNMIHRDVKPSNILLTQRGQPMLTDFGIAKILDLEETADLTGTGMGIGTPEYMAPEQWTGKTSPQSDQYSLGVVLYEMLTGRKPYSADTPAAILLKQATEPLPRPSELAHNLPEKVEKLLIKALARNPADRYASMGEFATVLESVLSGSAAPVKPRPARQTDHMRDTMATIHQIDDSIIKEQPAPGLHIETVAQSTPSGLLRYWPIGLVGGLIIVGLTIALIVSLTGNRMRSIATPDPIAEVPVPSIVSTAAEPVPTEPPIVTEVPIAAETPSEMTVSPDVRIINPQNANSLVTLQTPEQIDGSSSVAFSPDGTILAVGTTDVTIQLRNVSDGTILRTLKGHTRGILKMVFSPDGQTLVSVAWDKTIRVWRVSDGALLHTQEFSWWINDIALSPDGQTLATASYDWTVKLWGFPNFSLQNTLVGHSNGVNSTAFSPDGQTLATASYDNTVKLWRVSNGALLRTLEDQNVSVSNVAFSPDGKILAASFGDASIRMWNVDDGILLHMMQEHTGWIYSIAFSPDGAILASGYTDGTIRLWQVSDGTLLCTQQDAAEYVRSLAFSPDGTLLASSSSGNPVRLWGIP